MAATRQVITEHWAVHGPPVSVSESGEGQQRPAFTRPLMKEAGMMNAIAPIANQVVDTRYEDLSAEAVQATKTFLTDTIGVGVAGSAGPRVEELVDCARGWGASDEARVWVRGTRLPAPAAALCSAYQSYNAEFDCVHEAAVVHPMAALLAATLAHAERAGGISGRDLIPAIVLGVDVACHLGVGSKAPLTFFRPATAGAFRDRRHGPADGLRCRAARQRLRHRLQ
jgi:aconitate decarboxylase